MLIYEPAVWTTVDGPSLLPGSHFYCNLPNLEFNKYRGDVWTVVKSDFRMVGVSQGASVCVGVGGRIGYIDVLGLVSVCSPRDGISLWCLFNFHRMVKA